MSWTAIGATQIAGVFIEFASGTASTVAIITGVVAGATRALAILLGGTPIQVEWATAVGFAAGIGIFLFIFVLDFLWG
jgi:hypothetical protein